MGLKRDIVKRIIALILVLVALVQIIDTTYLTYALGNNYTSQLGTNKALGSPILNPNFVADDWNKWEMLTWGIFLSNFATPLIDDYNSAFNASSTTGSKGSGYKALQFGSGSDPNNASVLQELLNIAITQQKVGTEKQVYVKHTPADGITGIKNQGGGVSAGLENNGDSETDTDNLDDIVDGGTLDLDNLGSTEFRPAMLADFLFAGKEKDGDTFIDVGDTDGTINLKAQSFVNFDGYKPLYTFNSASLPTFAVYDTNNNFETIFDYTNSWDIQLLNAWFGKILTSDLAVSFADELNKMWDDAKSLPVVMDAFGNLTVKYKDSKRILIPASANQHLTDTPQINLINSLIFNGYLGSVNAENLALRGQQVTWSKLGWMLPGSSGTGSDRGKPDKSGVPAFGSRINGIKPGTTNLYFDLDTIIINDLVKNNSVVASGKYGNSVQKLFDMDIENLTGDYALKIEVSNLEDSKIGKLDKKIGNTVERTALASAMITNLSMDNPKAKILNHVKTNTKDVKLLANPIIVPVQADVGMDGTKFNNAGASRLFLSFMHDVYHGKITQTTAGNINKNTVTDVLSSSKTVDEFRKNSLVNPSGNISYLAAGFISMNDKLFNIKTTSPSNLLNATAPNDSKFFKKLEDSKYNGKQAVEIKYTTKKDEEETFQRMVKAYPVSNTMINISNALGAREGTDFAQWSTFIYMTYLDWYGLNLKKELGNKVTMESDFNKRIFDDKNDILNLDIMSMADIKSEEDKKKDVLNYSYLMLHPTEGREYRADLLMTGMTDWVYQNYNKTVYGNASNYYSGNNSRLATRNATGFLNIDSYSDNILTSWFMKMYVELAVKIILGVLILVIIMGLLRSKKLSWFFVTILITINSILIIPSTGEIVPYVTNKYVQSMFSKNMGYWAVTESIVNANMEKDLIDGKGSGLTEEEASQVADMVKALNVTYLDRSLMMKTDISRKVTETASGNYAKLQQMASARWMLPMVMRQFSANDSSADYVYIPLGDLFDDMSNAYWLYNEDDAATVQTVVAQETAGVEHDKGYVSSISANFLDYQEPNRYVDDRWSSPSYFNKDSSSADGEEHQGSSYDDKLILKDQLDVTHSYFYILENTPTLPMRKEGFGGAVGRESYGNYANHVLDTMNPDTFVSTSSLLESTAQEYIRSDRKTVKQEYGYLWTTEHPGHYFYQNVKDIFTSGDSLGSVVGELQGTFTTNDEGEEVRKSFAYAYDTGHIRDIADLEGLFRNTIPYLYQMMLATGGTTGESGLLLDTKITGYDLYKNNPKSWMYRSNWAVKMLENSDYIRPATVRDANGEKYKVENPMLPEYYPEDRPMVFSEAQQKEMGLHDADLSLIELKNVNVNRNIERRWTLLLNYANTDGMTKEVMLRQMALHSLIEFNKEFSPVSLLSGSKALYPNGVDLRAISFDSVMRMLVINVTKDASYAIGDTMKSVIENSDLFTAVLLLLAAFLTCYIIPLIRNAVLAAIFYLGLFAILRIVVGKDGSRSKVSMGYVLSNILFMVMTLIYYSIFSGLMTITTRDEVLTLKSVSLTAGNPVWLFIVIILASGVYVYAMFRMLDHCFKNFRDMGMEVYAGLASAFTEGITTRLDSLGNSILNWGAGGSAGGNSTATASTTSGSQSSVNVKVDGGDINSTTSERAKGDRQLDEFDTASYSYQQEETSFSDDEGTTIDSKIERGKQVDD